jgi:hypothetical protein
LSPLPAQSVTNEGGGASTLNCEFGCGTVYEIGPPTIAGGGWIENVIYSFIGGANGLTPSSLIQGPPGVFYGVTQAGGLYSRICPVGCGTVFSLTRSSGATAWTQKVLHRFDGGSGSAAPMGLVHAGNGELYGFAATGGVFGPACPDSGCGTIFELTPPSSPGGAWMASVLHRFSGESDGWNPLSLILDSSAGTLLGTAEYGGAGNGCLYNAGSYGCGTIFSLSF